MTSEVTQAALEPCPFCGGKAERLTLPEDSFGNGGGDVITCSRCQASSHVEFGRKENLVDRWNTRLTTQSGARRSGAIEAYLIERLEGEGYGPPRRIVDGRIHDPTSDAFWVNIGIKKRHRVTPLVAITAQSGKGRSGAGEDAIDWTSPLELLDGTPVRLTRDEETGDVDRHSNPDPDGDYWIEREDGHRIASTDRNSRSKAYRQLCVHANGCEEGTGTIVVRNRAALNARQSGEGERERAIDDGLMSRFRSALRFAASRSVISSADEQALLAALRATDEGSK